MLFKMISFFGKLKTCFHFFQLALVVLIGHEKATALSPTASGRSKFSTDLNAELIFAILCQQQHSSLQEFFSPNVVTKLAVCRLFCDSKKS